MNKQITALLITLVMLISLFTSCSKSTEATTPAETTASASETLATSTTAEATGATDSAQPTPPPVQSASPGSIKYPLSGSNTLTLWASFGTGINDLVSTYNDLPAVKAADEQTGVTLKFVEAQEAAAQEQYNLMIASGDYTDLINCTYDTRNVVGYIGGTNKAYSDGIIIDLTDLIPQYAPDYYNILFNETNAESVAILKSDDGKLLSFGSIKNETVYDAGLVIRKDLLDELGLVVPQTIDQFSATAKAIKDKYGMDKTVYLLPSGILSGVTGAFGSTAFDLSSASDLAPYIDDNGKVQFGVCSDGYRDYLEYLIDLINAGVIDEDFYSSADTGRERSGYLTGGSTAVAEFPADTLHNFVSQGQASSPNFALAGVPKLGKNAGDVYKFGDSTVLTSEALSVSTTCETPAVAVEYLNYFFTDAGQVLTNYGIEGVSFNYDSSGTPQFTDVVLNNPEMSAMRAVQYYGLTLVANFRDVTIMWPTYADYEVEAIETWSSNASSDCTYPVGATLSENELNSISSSVADIVSYASESMMKFITSATPLNDNTWAEVQAQIQALGVNECYDVYQAAYDRYTTKLSAAG